ncbi:MULTISPECIES: dihydropteroate synthase [unclassified Paenibacillus]|uniref:dihydropteroate synthase n=1 Tax=unclassified Paenibacillus TaxID=185978 RepID=UPI00095706DE|nr:MULTISPECIES: dihydropteroate synthase [unclassified Paenibacillus]ASS67728.1 dihydropteroate synthase [Paenibacillus sp. RUD330]SIR67563.1 dihydropteroate synthase [Paenibacillus sp. RU4X]SIR75331.1 dihydropteroate synthase [Paenibacillus sp. RU4T]
MYSRQRRHAVPKRRYELGGGVELELGERTLIMGILNATPDSFSDGGRHAQVDEAVRHALKMAREGADIIDVGGESTRPGYIPVPHEEELRRVVPLIERLRLELPDMPLSIDTYKFETARAALQAGAHIINDIWGLRLDTRMADAAAEFGCPVIISHNRRERNYEDLIPDVVSDLEGSVGIARAAGVAEENIWLDPGIGFAKTHEDNVALMGSLSELAELGYPVLLGTSRKRFIRDTLGLPVGELIEGTAATVALGIAQGCQIVRVHDIEAIRKTCAMTDAIVYGPR